MINQMKYYNCNRYCSEEHINESNVSLSLAVLLSKLFIIRIIINGHVMDIIIKRYME